MEKTVKIEKIEIEKISEKTKSQAEFHDDDATRCWAPCPPPLEEEEEELEVLEVT